MNVYTFFDPRVKTLPDQHGLIRLWQQSWSSRGWNPRILTPRDAERHPDYKSFAATISNFPSLNEKAYENACYLRWLALHVQGGGWLTDYDVINRNFKPRRGKNAVEMLDSTYVPCAVWANKNGAEELVKVISNYRTHPGQNHVSDMLIFKTLFEGKLLGIPSCQVVEFTVPGWETSPLIHFAAGKCKEYPDKVSAIQANVKC